MNNPLSTLFLQHPFIMGSLILWALFWKGMALWRAARREEKGWFIALLVINTVGILEIFYLLVIAKEENSSLEGKE